MRHRLGIAPALAPGAVLRSPPRPALAPDPDELEGLINPAGRALYLVHQLGLPRDSERCLAVARVPPRDVREPMRRWVAAT